MKRKHLSIKYIMILLILLLALPVIGIMSYTSYEHERRQYRNALEFIEVSINNITSVQQGSVEDIQSIFTILKALLGAYSYDPAAYGKVLHNVVKQNSDYTLMLLASPTGNVISSSADKINFNVFDRRYFQDALSSHSFSAGEYVVGRSSGKPTLHFASPLYDNSGDLMSMLIVGLDLARFDKIFQILNLPEQSTLMLCDRRGVILYRTPDNQRFLGSKVPSDLWMHLTDPSRQGEFYGRGMDNVSRLYAYRQVRIAGSSSPYMYILLGIPRSYISAPTHYFLPRDLVFLFLIFVMVALLAFIAFDYLVVRRTRQLLITAKRIGEGDFSARLINPLINDEIAQLFEAFNRMAVDLERHEQERDEAVETLEQLHVELEQHVLERTAEISHANARFSAIFNSSPIAIILVDNKTRFLVDVNQSFLNTFDFNREQVLGYTLDELSLWVDSLSQQHFTELLDIWGCVANMDVNLKTSLGGEVPVLLTASRVHVGIQDYLLIFMVDISDRKNMESEILNMKKLESVGVLAGGIAHDFNNLLTAITGNISLSMDLLCQNSTHKLAEKLTAVERAADKASILANQLMAFSKGGAPVKRRINLAQLIQEAVDLSLSGANVKSFLDIEPSLYWVEADEGQLSQTMNNLLINAKQAMPNGGQISVNAINKTLTISKYKLQPGKYVQIRVVDEGVGIEKSNLNRIFDPYFTTKPTGTGLGLASVYAIVMKHGGHISVESEVGFGTTFEILLPAVEHHPPTPVESNPTPLIVGNGRVLIMDDQESVREVLSEMLTSLGYRVDASCDGMEALRMYRSAMQERAKYDAVILDMTIPGGMGGKETIVELLKIDPEVKAFVSSGYSDDQVLSDFKSYKFSGIISKPYKLSDLSIKLAEILHHE